MSDETSPTLGTQGASLMGRAFYHIFERDQRIAALQLDLDAIRDASATWKEDHATMENLRARFPWITDYDDGDPFPTEFRIISARIAALEAQVARLTADVSMDEAADCAGTNDHDMVDEVRGALTAFLERRMKG